MTVSLDNWQNLKGPTGKIILNKPLFVTYTLQHSEIHFFASPSLLGSRRVKACGQHKDHALGPNIGSAGAWTHQPSDLVSKSET